MSKDKLPAFQFYPQDWRKDLRVQTLSFEHRAIWFELICIMFEAEERGKLSINYTPISARTLSQLVGCSLKQMNSCIEVLLNQKVAYKDENGIIYNKRMVEDERIRKIRAEAGVKGGNPALLNQQPKQKGKQNPTPSSSSSSSKESKDSKKENIKENLSDLTAPYVEKYGNVMVGEFIRYWTAKNKAGKERWEKQEFFDIGGRLATWHGNNLNRTQFNPSSTRGKFVM